MLVFILVLAAFLRLTNLGWMPYLFDGDETAIGYYSYSLAHFGTDEYGHRLPIYFSSIGDFKYPLYAYMGTVWVKLFGLSETTTRMTSAVSGLLAVALIAVIAGKLTKNRKVMVYSSILMALSPWHIWMSRRALEANLGLTLILLAAATAMKKWWGLTVVFAGLAMFSYPGSRIFVMALAVTGLGYFLAQRKRAEIVTCLIILGIGLAAFMSPESRARGADITAWNRENMTIIQKEVALDAHADGLAGPSVPIVVTRAFHNKLFYLGKEMVDKALAHFDLTYLFVKGEQRDRYSIPRVGLLTYAEGLAIVPGIFYLYGRNKKWWMLAIGWWGLAAVAPAITTEPVHSVRYATAIAAIVFIGGWGLTAMKVKLRLVVLLLLAINFLYFWHQYVIAKTYLNPWILETELPQLPGLVAREEPYYQAISLPGDAYIYFLFYNKVAPAKFLSESTIDTGKFGWNRVNKMGKIVFKMTGQCPKIGKQKTLYMCIGPEIPLNARVLELARYRDGAPAFSLIQFFPISQVKNEPLPEGLHRMVESDFRFNKDGLLPDSYPELWL